MAYHHALHPMSHAHHGVQDTSHAHPTHIQQRTASSLLHAHVLPVLRSTSLLLHPAVCLYLYIHISNTTTYCCLSMCCVCMCCVSMYTYAVHIHIYIYIYSNHGMVPCVNMHAFILTHYCMVCRVSTHIHIYMFLTASTPGCTLRRRSCRSPAGRTERLSLCRVVAPCMYCRSVAALCFPCFDCV